MYNLRFSFQMRLNRLDTRKKAELKQMSHDFAI